MNFGFNVILSIFLLIFSFPLWFIFFACIKLTSNGPFLFTQKRVGKNKKIFTMFKFRTMINNAEDLKQKYLYLNEAHGPIFKIRNDPRYTKVGKFLARTGLDELPQLINIIKGEMAFVGPRPLPVDEAKKIPSKYQKRFSVLPGITSLWVIRGAHKLPFNKWMKLDLEYIQKKSLTYDLHILCITLVLIIQFTLSALAGKKIITFVIYLAK